MSVKKIPIAIGIKPNQVATFTNKTISGSNNTLTNIGNSSLVNKTITLNGTPVELGGSAYLSSYSLDYSNDPAQPTAISYAQGHLNIEGSVVSGNKDYVTFTVGNTPITALYLTHYNSVDGIAFFAIQQGSSWTAGQDVSLMTTYSHFGPGAPVGYRVNDNVLAAPNPDVTLAANTTYTMWIQQTGNNATRYTFSTNPSYVGSWALVDTNTTYSIKASTAASGANLDLDAGGSGTGTDSVNFIGAGNVTVTRLDANTIRISDAGALGGVALTADNTATLTNKTISGANNTLTNIPNTALLNNSITINGQSVALGGSITVAGGGGGGSGDVTLTGIQTLTNKTISGSNNTLSNIGNASLTNPFISINGTQVALGTNFTVSGLGDVTLTGTQDLSNKSLLAPVIQDAKVIGTFRVGVTGGGNPGTAGQVLKSTGTGVQWATENQITAASLTIGNGLSSSGVSEFNGSNGITVSINSAIVATLTGTQTLSNKTLSGATLSGALTLSNGVGSAGQVLVSTGTGVQWGAGGGGGGGSFNGPASATDNAIVRFDGTTGATAQNSLVTISDTGVITAPSVASVIPFYHANQLSFPSASTYNGAVAVSANDNTIHFASGGNWIQLAKSSEVAISARQTFQTTTGSLANNATAYPDITNAHKSYLLFKIVTDKAAWVRVYTSTNARTADASRNIDTDPFPGSGVIAEVITAPGFLTQVLTSGVIGFNDQPTPVNTIYLSVTNRSGSTGTVTVTLTALKLEA